MMERAGRGAKMAPFGVLRRKCLFWAWEVIGVYSAPRGCQMEGRDLD
jgi:hypothetical protein